MQDGVYDEFARKFTAGTAVMPIGNSFDKGIVIGPMAKASAHDKAEERLQDAIVKGANVATGRVRHGAGSFSMPRRFCPTRLATWRSSRKRLLDQSSRCSGSRTKHI